MIELREISKTYNKGKSNEQKVLDQLSITIPDGAYISIMGRSGAGKSTLLHILAGLIPFDEGEYHLNEHVFSPETAKMSKTMVNLRRKQIGIVMQQFALIHEYSVYDNIRLPLDLHGMRRREIKERIAQVMEELELTDLRKKTAGSLSGGQKQRLAIARALVTQPSILLADEPTGSLDEKSEEEIMKQFKKIHQEHGTAIVLITHNPQIAKDSDVVYQLCDGKITQ